MEEERNKSAMHIAALVLGIISVLTTIFWYICWPTGILAIIFGVKSAKKLGSKMGKAGMVLGIVGLSLSAFAYIGMIVLIVLSNM